MGEEQHIFFHKVENILVKVLSIWLWFVWNSLRKDGSNIFKGNVWFTCGLDLFSQNNINRSQKMFGCGGLFGTLKGMQLFVNKP